jgi:pimeloyl-ACP methyl ester carboxylesterase
MGTPYALAIFVTAENTPNPATPNTIVLIHGLWMTSLSWEHWIDRYEARSFRVLAPAWPGMDGDIDGANLK